MARAENAAPPLDLRKVLCGELKPHWPTCFHSDRKDDTNMATFKYSSDAANSPTPVQNLLENENRQHLPPGFSGWWMETLGAWRCQQVSHRGAPLPYTVPTLLFLLLSAVNRTVRIMAGRKETMTIKPAQRQDTSMGRTRGEGCAQPGHAWVQRSPAAGTIFANQ